MRVFGLDVRRAERRDFRNPENPAHPLTSDAWASLLAAWQSTSGVTVTIDVALGVPAIYCGVNVLADLLASLPFHEFKRDAQGNRERVTTGMIAGMLSGTVNDDFLTSYEWRKGRMISALLTGAGRTYIETDAADRLVNLWPMETSRTTVKREGFRTIYRYRQPNGKVVEYKAEEVIDLQWMPKVNGLGCVDPVRRMADTIGLAVALERYASKYFQNGGVPPLALHTPIGSPAANDRAKKDTDAAVRRAASGDSASNILLLPLGTDLRDIGFDPSKGQLVEAQRFVIQQIARMLNLPPSFLHDLTNGSFQNTEQGDLHLAKHTALAWVRRWEAECNAKLYGPRANSRFVEMDLDGLQRGDFKTRMEGYARGIQTGVFTPNEVRRKENLPALDGGEHLFMQGATVPIDKAGQVPPPAVPPQPTDENEGKTDA